MGLRCDSSGENYPQKRPWQLPGALPCEQQEPPRWLEPSGGTTDCLGVDVGKYNALSDLAEVQIESFKKTQLHESADGCTIWLGHIDREGYGIVSVRFGGVRRATGAHRIAYILAKGRIPDEYVIDHLCRTRNCVNADHLEAVTNAENVRRGFPGRPPVFVDACPAGHPTEPGSYYLSPKGYKQCRACRYASKVRYRAKLKAAKAAA